MAQTIDDLTRLMTASNASRYQGSGSGGWGTALRYLGAIGGGLSGMSQKGIIPAFLDAAGNIGQVQNESAYNRYLKDQANYQKRLQIEQDMNDATINYNRTGFMPHGNFSRDFANQAAGDIRQNNALQSWQDVINGQPLQLNPQGAYSDAQIKNYLDQQAKVANTKDALGLAREVFQGGQQASSIGGVPQPMAMANPNGLIEPAGLDTSYGGQAPLQGSIQGQNIKPQTASPYYQSTIDPADIFGQFQQGAKDKQELGKQTIDQYGNVTTRQHYQRSDSETSRHNKVSEAVDRINAQAHMISARKSGSGGSGGNPFTIPNAALENTSKQIEIAKKNLQALGLWDKKQDQPLQLTAPDQTTTEWNPLTGRFLQKSANPGYNSYLTKQRAIDNYRALTGNLPFGGQSQTKLENTFPSPGEWNKGKK